MTFGSRFRLPFSLSGRGSSRRIESNNCSTFAIATPLEGQTRTGANPSGSILARTVMGPALTRVTQYD